MRQPVWTLGERRNEEERGREEKLADVRRREVSFFPRIVLRAFRGLRYENYHNRGDLVLPEWQLFTVREKDTWLIELLANAMFCARRAGFIYFFLFMIPYFSILDARIRWRRKKYGESRILLVV